MNVIALVVSYTAASACAWAGIRAYLSTRKVKAIITQLQGRQQLAAEDRKFVMWANWTMLSVTDNRGYVHAATLRQLYTTGRWDAIWDAPTTVAIWHGDPDTVHRYVTELGQEENRG